MSEMVFYKGGQMEFVLVRGGKLAFDEHCHASDIVISGITGGCALLTLGGAVKELCEGDIFSVLPYENHSLRSQAPVGMLTMCIKKDLFSQEKAVYTQFVVGAVNGLCGCEGISETEKDIAQKLCEAALTIYDAAVESGFYVQSHFDRYFKKIVGIPPKEYIRSLRNFVQE